MSHGHGPEDPHVDEPNVEPSHSGGHDHEHGPLAVPEVWAKRILIAFGIGCVLLFIVDFMDLREIHHPFEEIPGFYGVYGFVGVAGLIVLSKELRKIVMRGEDYYDDE